jgi:hypothetical protein
VLAKFARRVIRGEATGATVAGVELAGQHHTAGERR